MSTDKISVFRVTPRMHKLLKVLADKEERSINNMIQILLHRVLKNSVFSDEESNKAVAEYFATQDTGEPGQILEG